MVGLWKEEFGRERQGIRVYGWMDHPGLRKKRDDEGQCAIMIIRTRTLALSLRRRQTLVNGAPSLSSPCTFPYYFLVHIHCSILRLLPLPILANDHRYHIYVPIYYFTSVNSCFPDIPYPVHFRFGSCAAGEAVHSRFLRPLSPFIAVPFIIDTIVPGPLSGTLHR